MMRPKISDDEFWNECQTLQAEIEDAISIFYTHEELNRLGREDQAVFTSFNKNAHFWNVINYSLQTSLFILLARIFDADQNARSIHWLVNATLAQPERFSRDAIKGRRMVGRNEEPVWLKDFLDTIWIPASASDLRFLKKELAPHARKFVEVYRPIRHTYVAHRIRNVDVPQMFQRTVRSDVGEILNFLRDLVREIMELFSNGRKPELGRRADYDRSVNQQIGEETKNVVMIYTDASGK